MLGIVQRIKEFRSEIHILSHSCFYISNNVSSYNNDFVNNFMNSYIILIVEIIKTNLCIVCILHVYM